MFKKFSVEWLSQSFHAQDPEQEKCVKLIACAPDAFSGAPQASSEMHGEGETKAPSSPTSKYDRESASQRRVRTKFSSEQISRLEKSFSKHKYLGATQRRRTAEKLQLSETQVKTWFQNRRMKLKREVQDARAAEFFVDEGGHCSKVVPNPIKVPQIPARQIPPPTLFPSCYF
uniref:Homeobox domain-containing protein n=1 Tax=Sinocyclocheilus grahami TaxID=75366 RepID=A0A672NH89_SINGR